MLSRGSVFLLGCVLLLCHQEKPHLYTFAQTDGNLWNDNNSNSNSNSNTAIAYGRQDTSPDASKKILLDLYAAAGGYDWTDDSNWKQSAQWDGTENEFCSWKGIFCYDGTSYPDRRGYIQQIDLGHNNLHGSIPGSVFGLPYLESLSFEGNQDLTIDLSDGIENAQFLRFLNLGQNRVANLDRIDSASSLEVLSIKDMNLSGTIPTTLMNLPKLKVLRAGDNSFSGPLPGAIGQLTSLEELTLSNNDLTGQLPENLGQLSMMQILTLTNNAFGGTMPVLALEKMTNLRTIAIQRIPIDGNPNSIKGPGISGSAPSFRDHRKLTKVQLENQRLSGGLDLAFCASCPTGEPVEIDLRYNRISGGVPTGLSDKRFLNLYLAGNKIKSIPSEIYNSFTNTCPMIQDWMGGDIQSKGCDAFLCPPGTWAPQGRATSTATCERCNDNGSLWGRTECQSSLSGTESERQILVNVYNALGGRNWKTDNNWLDPAADMCGWYGVGCDSASGRVISLVLRNNGLNGMVPSDLFDLQGLKILNLESNQIEIDFSAVSKAVNLESLNLAATGLRFLNTLQNLSALPNFRYLSLASNGLSGIIPEAVFSITSLEDLDLSYNDFSGPLSPSLGRLTNLKRFNCNGADLTGQLPAEIGSLTNLEDFSAAENKFSGSLPNTLNSLNNLETLSLQQVTENNAGITGPLLSFTNLEQLRSMHLDGNLLTGTLPTNFLINSRRLQAGIDVGLSDNRLRGTIPDGWSRFNQLAVDLAGNQISGIASSLCLKSGWMNGAVQSYQCDAILCPAGTYNTIGYKTDAVSSCLDCPSSTSFGATYCLSQGTTDVSSELNILRDIFSAAGGNDWRNNDGWDSSADYCSAFYGVECDGVGRVTSLNLANNNLKGTIPQSVYQLNFLRTITLSKNSVGLSFGGIAAAEKLIELYLDNTNMDSLQGISGGANLQILNVADNNLGGTVPDEIYRITTLKEINLGHNSFSGQLKDVIGGLKSLESLSLYHNQFTGRIPAAIGDLINLEVLNLAENNFDGTIPAELNGLTNLNFLSLQREGGISGYNDVGINQGKSSLQGIGLTGPLPSFDKLTRITQLFLGVNGLTGSIPYDFLGGVQNKASRIVVDLTSNTLTGTLPASLTQFDNMSLYAAGNRFTVIADGLCSKSGWLSGDVGSYACNGILCPVGTFNAIGRQSGISPSCQACSTATNDYLGSFECLSSSDAQEGSEREILEKLYYGMDGPNWIDNSNWLDPDVSICDWYGIQCDSLSAKSVTSIDLSYNGLSNEFPNRTYKLPNLKELNLQGNPIIFTFTGIRNAVNLESLDLEDTGLASLFGIGQAANSLKLLRVDSNNLASFPDEILDLRNLEVLSLSSNMFSQDEIPSNLQFLSSMTYFACSGCAFTGPIPNWLGSMQNLQYLKLSKNALTGTLPSFLESITTLKHLDLSDQATGGFGLSGNLLSFATQTDLTELYLQHNNFQGAIPDNFLSSVRNDQLVTVDLRFNRFNGLIPAQFGNFNQLNLYLASNAFESIPEFLCGYDWNDGDVAQNGCDGLLCPAGSFNSFGRATAGVDCFACNEAVNSMSMGNIFCGSALEHESLKILYRSYGGPNWSSSNNWLESEDHCTWEGITCWDNGDYMGLVKRIELAAHNLVGDMPFALIWQLEGLVYIDLQKNDISLPFFMIGNAVNLETIILSYTATSSLDGIGEAKSLKELHLTSTVLMGTLPEELFALPLLESLFLSNNGFSGTMSAEFGTLKKLKNLYLLGNQLTGTIPTELGYLARLEHLSLGKNRLQGSIPRQITSLPLLEFLSLENEADSPNQSFTSASGLSGPLPALDGFPRIRELYLQHNSFTGTIADNFMQGIHDKKAKITIDLGFNNIDGSIPKELSSFDDLNLLLVGNEISGIPTEVCNNIGWMNGEVANSCDSILCPPGTYNAEGRQVTTSSPCETCTYAGSARKYGSTSCGPGSTDALDDRSILFDLYDATGGDSWTTSTGWKSDTTPYCDWYGVTCTQTNTGDLTVSELNLSKNNLNGIVPSKVYFLQGLKKLDVKQNPVTITFQDVDRASQLEELYIDETLVKNMNGIGGAPKLKVLHAYKNSFGGQELPDEIFDILTLTDLNIADSMLAGPLSGKIGKLTKLQRVTLDGNSFSGELPSQFGLLPALKEIEMSNNKWIGTLPSSWEAITSLEAIFLNNHDEKTAGVTGSLAAFANMPNMRTLSLSNNQLTGSIPSNFLSGISGTNSLITVRLDQNHIMGTIPSSLRIFSKLNIDVTGNYITAIGDGLCNQSEWNDGTVGKYSCDGILCPAGTFSPSGRQTSSIHTCESCPGEENSSYLGDTTCVTLVKQQEKEILSKLFQATNGENWKHKDGWTDANSEVCSWYGIECREGSTVESVRLGSNHLVGYIPEEIFELPNLKSLWLYSNPVQFSFDGIGKATKLKSLRLDSTKLKSLDGIRDGLSLVDIDVGFNELTGRIPAGLENLVDLENFSGTVNALTGTVPDFSNTRKLSTLRLSNNKLTGSLPSFSRHSNMKSIDLSNNKLKGSIPSNFLESVNQEETLLVDLSNNMLAGNVPGSLSRVKDMTIYLRDNRIVGIDPSLCSKDGWNEGDVGTFQCDGILCPSGTYAIYGRASITGSLCESCKKNKYYGGTTCGGRSAGASRKPVVTTLVVLSVATSLATLLL